MAQTNYELMMQIWSPYCWEAIYICRIHPALLKWSGNLMDLSTLIPLMGPWRLCDWPRAAGVSAIFHKVQVNVINSSKETRKQLSNSSQPRPTIWRRSYTHCRQTKASRTIWVFFSPNPSSTSWKQMYSPLSTTQWHWNTLKGMIVNNDHPIEDEKVTAPASFTQNLTHHNQLYWTAQ